MNAKASAGTAAESPRSVGRLRRVPSEVTAYPASHKLVEAIVAPLLQDVAAKPPLNPLLQLLERSLRLAEPEIRFPSGHVLPKLVDHLLESNSPCSVGAPPDLGLELIDRSFGDRAPVRTSRGERETEEPSLPRSVHGALGLVHFELQSPHQVPGDAFQHSLSGFGAFDVDITIVCIPREPVPPPFECLIHFIEEQVYQQGRYRTVLRRAFSRGMEASFDLYARLEETADEPEYAFIAHPLLDEAHQFVVVYPIEELLQVHVYDLSAVSSRRSFWAVATA